MADADDTGGPGRGSFPGTPRWVKVLAAIALVLIVLVIIVLLAGGGSHGPGRHTSSDEAAGRAAAAGMTQDGAPSGDRLEGHTPPAGGH